jgi:hypothetical protein
VERARHDWRFVARHFAVNELILGGSWMKRKKRKKSAGEGYAYLFHGSYTSKPRAETKAEKRGGWLITRVPRGSSKRRYIVLTERTLF